MSFVALKAAWKQGRPFLSNKTKLNAAALGGKTVAIITTDRDDVLRIVFSCPHLVDQQSWLFYQNNILGCFDLSQSECNAAAKTTNKKSSHRRTRRGGRAAPPWAWKISGQTLFSGEAQVVKNPECKKYIQYS